MKKIIRRAPEPKVPQPPVMRNGDGELFMRQIRPVRMVQLDAGVFDYLWRLLETRLANDAHYGIEAHMDLLARGCESFRAAIRAEQEPEPEPAVTRRVIKRK